MKVYYGDHDEKELLTEVASMDEAMQYVVKQISDKKYGGYYQRWYTVDGVTTVDYGSHTKFYYVMED